MAGLVKTIALGAALVTLVICVWRDYGLVPALLRVATAYLVAFFTGALLVIGGHAIASLTGRAAAPEPAVADSRAGRRRRAASREANRVADPKPAEAAAPASAAE